MWILDIMTEVLDAGLDKISIEHSINTGKSAQSHSWKRKYQLRNTESSLTPTEQNGEGGGSLGFLCLWFFIPLDNFSRI